MWIESAYVFVGGKVWGVGGGEGTNLVQHQDEVRPCGILGYVAGDRMMVMCVLEVQKLVKGALELTLHRCVTLT